jgi:uncharacterized protein (TIGR03083 family)
MATTPEATDRAQWDAANPANKDRLLRVVREEAERLFAYADVSANWEAPTASGHWQVRDIIGHMVDVTEGYLNAFDLARTGGTAPAPHGLRVMARLLDEHAQAFRSLSQTEMMRRIRDDFARMMAVFAGLTAEEWTGFMVSHPYMGPVPAFIYPVFHLVDYGVHGWDVREGLGIQSGLTGDTADFLVPIMFILWQSTTDLESVGEPVSVGIRVSGRNGGTWRIGVSASGYTYEAGPIDDLPAAFDFDPSSLILTAYGRINGGTSYGDQAIAERYRGLFYAI